MASSSRIPRDLNDSIRILLGKNAKITLKCPVRLVIKGDKTENKVLVFTTYRLYVIAARIPSKIDLQFHYLDIQGIESKTPNRMVLTSGEKNHTFYSLDDESTDVETMILHLSSSLREIFPALPLLNLMKIDVMPPERVQSIWKQSQSSLKEASGACGCFSKQYACMCDYLGLPFREEVAWDVDTIYLFHDSKELNLHDFDHLDGRDLVPIVATLTYNGWFTKFRTSHIKLNSDVIEQILQVIRTSSSLEDLYLDSTNIKADFLQKMLATLNGRSDVILRTLDFSNNLIEDKGCSHLAKIVARTAKGLLHLNLAKTGLTPKGVNLLAQSLSANKFTQSTLTYLNLADNSLKDESSSLFNFLAQPNSVTHLDLSGTDCSYELLFGALIRGSCQQLSHINLSRNVVSHKKNKENAIVPLFKQFFSTSVALKYLNMSQTKLPPEVLKNLLLGIASNPSLSDIELDLSSCCLGSSGAHVLETCFQEIRCLASLDISDNALESDLGQVLASLAKNKSIKRLSLGRNFISAKAKHVPSVMEHLVQMVQDEDSVIEYLSLADSKLKGDICNFINALGSNHCLVTVDISGNFMGDAGARLLAKALQINTRLRAIIYDKNSITVQGFHDLSCAMESNYTVRYMPFPLHDALIAMKTAPDKTESSLRKIESLLHRNVSPKKCTNEQAFRLQQGFLLSSTQQMVDKLVVQTQDIVTSIKRVSGDMLEEDIQIALGYVADADNSKKLLTRLQEVVLRREAIGNPIDVKLHNVTDELNSTIEEHLQGTVKSMLDCVKEHCPNVVSSERVQQELQRAGKEKSNWPKDFVYHCLVETAGTEVMNKLNEIHLAVAASISDQIVDEVIHSLSKSYKALAGLSGDSAGVTPDQLRRKPRADSDASKNEVAFGNLIIGADSPNATPQLSSKRKTVNSRKMRPQSVMDDLLLGDLPGSEPKLEHLVKARPKRMKTKAPTRPTLKTTEVKVDQNINEGLDNFFQKHNSDSSPVGGKKSSILKSSSLERILGRKSKIPEENQMQLNFTPDGESPTTKSPPHVTFLEKTVTAKPKTQLPKQVSVDKSPLPAQKNNKPESAVEVVVAEKQAKKPVGLPTLGINGDMLVEMRAKQEKRLSMVHLTKSKIETSTTANGNVIDELNSNESDTSPSPKSGASPNHGINQQSPSVPIPHVRKNSDMSPSYDRQSFGDGKGFSSSPKTKPPPPAPKPRPRSVIGNDGRKSDEFSPMSEVSSDVLHMDSPDGGDMMRERDESTDSGLVGSRDSLSPAAESGNVDDAKQKAASLPGGSAPPQTAATETSLQRSHSDGSSKSPSAVKYKVSYAPHLKNDKGNCIGGAELNRYLHE